MFPFQSLLSLAINVVPARNGLSGNFANPCWFRNSTRICEYLGLPLPLFPPSWPFVFSLPSLHSRSLLYFFTPFPRPPSFFCAPPNPPYVISFTWSFAYRLFRSYCLRISVFHNSLSLTPSTSPPPVVPRTNHKNPFILWHRTFFSLLLHAHIPHLTCERFTLHVIFPDFQNNGPRNG